MCKEHQFQCKSDASCIPAHFQCDFVNDCRDGSDESSSECEKTSFIQSECDSEDYFHCKLSRKCIPKNYLCDGMNDCGLAGKYEILDKSDEDQNCTKICPENMLPCSDDTCIHISKFCNGYEDCFNDEEDAFCIDRSEELCKNLQCEYRCNLTPYGPKCYCPQGKILSGTKCVVQRDCFADGDICDQNCVYGKTISRCACEKGYERVNNKCYGINGECLQLF